MRTIYRYELMLEDEQEVPIPFCHQILSVAKHREHSSRLELWAIVETDTPTTTKKISIRGTGHPMRCNEGLFLGTVQTHDGMFVWHVFETIT